MLLCTLCTQSFRFPPPLSHTCPQDWTESSQRLWAAAAAAAAGWDCIWPVALSDQGPIDTADVNLSHYSRLGDSLAQMESTHSHNVIDMLKQKATLLPSPSSPLLEYISPDLRTKAKLRWMLLVCCHHQSHPLYITDEVFSFFLNYYYYLSKFKEMLDITSTCVGVRMNAKKVVLQRKQVYSCSFNGIVTPTFVVVFLFWTWEHTRQMEKLTQAGSPSMQKGCFEIKRQKRNGRKLGFN